MRKIRGREKRGGGERKNKKMVPVGFEPTHLSVAGLKSAALDHSAIVPQW